MKIFERICEILASDKEAVLATIISAAGSTPAPNQSKMLIRTQANFASIGTVGGGCLDQNIVLTLNDGEFTGKARICTYHLDDDDGDTGLTCGGTVNVLVERIDSAMEPIFRKAIERYSLGEASFLLTGLTSDPRKTLLDRNGNIVAGYSHSGGHIQALHGLIAQGTGLAGPQKVQLGSEEYILEYIEAPTRVIIFGGGHVGKVTSRCAVLTGLSVTIVDDRQQYANKDRFPEADRICCENFEDAIQSLKITGDDYIVIVTRGHKYDELILEKILPMQPKYIGMIGSKRKVKLCYDKLEARGASRELLEKVHAPIGLDIAAETVEEIGVSIVAEIIAVRRGAGNHN
jgi:xanthine dehydrogenase accessory factor